MRALFLSLAIVMSTIGVAGCASFGSAVEQVQPRTPREAVAVAEVAFVGAVTFAADLHRNGILSSEDAREDVLPRLEQAAALLDLARRAINVGDQVAAGQAADAARIILEALAVELSHRLEASQRNPA